MMMTQIGSVIMQIVEDEESRKSVLASACFLFCWFEERRSGALYTFTLIAVSDYLGESILSIPRDSVKMISSLDVVYPAFKFAPNSAVL